MTVHEIHSLVHRPSANGCPRDCGYMYWQQIEGGAVTF